MTDPVLIPHLVEAAFGGTWRDDPDDLTWTDVTDRVRVVQPVNVVRGRAIELDRTPQAGTLSLQFDSSDGALTPENPASPYFPNVQTGLPLRFSVQDAGGVWRQQGYMFATDPKPIYPTDVGDTTWLSVTAVDAFSFIAAQAAERLTYLNHVLTDLAGGRTLEWVRQQDMEVRKSTGLSTTGVLFAGDFQAWGLAWFWLLAGVLAWTAPGAAAVISESGAGDDTGQFGWNTGVGQPIVTAVDCGFASDRFGGAWRNTAQNGSGATLVASAAKPDAAHLTGTNWTRQQVVVGRPPQQLLPVSVCDPTDASQWTAPAGDTLARVAASGLAWVPRRDVFDPVTKARVSTLEGPAGAIAWTQTSSSAEELVSSAQLVTPLQWYAAHAALSAGAGHTIGLRWFDSTGTAISTTPTGSRGAFSSATGPAMAGVVGQAPAGAVTVRIVIFKANGTPATRQLYAPGLYPALPTGRNLNGTPVYLTPARWWAPGEHQHLRLFGQWPLGEAASLGIDDGGQRLWLHADAVVDGLDNGAPHSIAWDVHPGVDGVPTIWVDNVEVDATWRLSWPGATIGFVSGVGGTLAMYAAGQGSAANAGVAMTVGQPCNVATLLTISGSYRWRQAPTAALVNRWHQAYGAPDAITLVSLTDTTDVAIGTVLDALGWPKTQRDIDTGRSVATIRWDDDMDLTDYSQVISALAALESGWTGVDERGRFVWRARRWYDPDGDGLTEPVAHLHYDPDEPGTIPYSIQIDQDFSDRMIRNRVLASSSTFSAEPALIEDHDSQDRIGTRPLTVSQPWRTQDEVDEVAAELAALYAPRLMPQQVRWQARGPRDPNLATMLTLQPAQVVRVTIPRYPAADVTVTALVGQRTLNTDGVDLYVDLTLGACPATAVPPDSVTKVRVALDTDGVPYFTPSVPEDQPRVSLDTDGVPYFSDPGTLSVLIDTDGVPYVEVP